MNDPIVDTETMRAGSVACGAGIWTMNDPIVDTETLAQSLNTKSLLRLNDERSDCGYWNQTSEPPQEHTRSLNDERSDCGYWNSP